MASRTPGYTSVPQGDPAAIVAALEDSFTVLDDLVTGADTVLCSPGPSGPVVTILTSRGTDVLASGVCAGPVWQAAYRCVTAAAIGCGVPPGRVEMVCRPEPGTVVGRSDRGDPEAGRALVALTPVRT